MWGQLAGVIFSEEGFGGETWAAVTSCRARLVSTGHEGPSPTPTPPPTSGSEDFRTSVALVFGSPQTFSWELERLARGVEHCSQESQ